MKRATIIAGAQRRRSSPGACWPCRPSPTTATASMAPHVSTTTPLTSTEKAAIDEFLNDHRGSPTAWPAARRSGRPSRRPTRIRRRDREGPGSARRRTPRRDQEVARRPPGRTHGDPRPAQRTCATSVKGGAPSGGSSERVVVRLSRRLRDDRAMATAPPDVLVVDDDAGRARAPWSEASGCPV